jgi:hypothetical protein
MVRTFTRGESVTWRTISGVDLAGHVIMGGHGFGEVIGPDPNDPSRILVRRLTSDRTVVSLASTQIE